MKNTTTVTLLSVLALSMGAGMMTAHADVKTPTYSEDGATATTPASVTFTAPKENDTKPSVPGTDPDHPENPTDNEGSNSKALLKIAYISNLTFNTHDVSATNKAYNADLIKTSGADVAPFVQISDNRGTGAGWQLKVKQDREFQNADGKVLTGAYVDFKTPSVLGVDGQSIKTDVTGSAAKLSGDGTELPIMTAAQGAGTGTVFGQFGTNSGDNTTEGVQMNVVGGTALASQYETTLTWALSATPV